MSSLGGTPYVLSGDLNVLIHKSDIIQRFIEAGLAVDLPEAWRPADEPQQVTFSKFANIREGDSGSNMSRIDTILANPAAAAAVLEIEFLFELGSDYDHLPIAVTLDIDVFNEERKTLPKPAKVNYENIKMHKWTEAQRQDVWREKWTGREEQFKKLLENLDLQAAHEL